MKPPGATPSLVQQRMVLARARTAAVWVIVFAALLTSMAILQLANVDPAPPIWRWLALLAYLAILVVGIVRVIASVRRIRAFEAAHGRDAGRQLPVRR
ncbi:hypothetical protein [Microbacterium sp.]|uniref:hypothetical protein n=1 Tax=Microbacterium sp. TaxID=51671 RepID=UPI00391A8C54